MVSSSFSEMQMMLRRDLCHSDLHRECHMVLSCGIALLGIQCLTQGHFLNPG